MLVAAAFGQNPAKERLHDDAHERREEQRYEKDRHHLEEDDRNDHQDRDEHQKRYEPGHRWLPKRNAPDRSAPLADRIASPCELFADERRSFDSNDSGRLT